MYRWVEHTAEVELQIEDDSPEAVFTEALVAFGDLVADRPGGDPVSHRVRVTASDLPTLLAEWMNELVYLADTDGFVPERVDRLDLAEGALEAQISGRRNVTRSLVKAVTYHRLQLRQADRHWRATVVLDV